ncbi:MAG: PAS domain-containing protein [Desulfovibrio sp.]|jgi:PAS domain S-box-containing protein|nr:PAS domain-containing protein [Desulfovibrio sp.]
MILRRIWRETAASAKQRKEKQGRERWVGASLSFPPMQLKSNYSSIFEENFSMDTYSRQEGENSESLLTVPDTNANSEQNYIHANIDINTISYNIEYYTRLLLKNSPNSVILLDREGYIVACSDAFLLLLRLKNHDQLKGRHLKTLNRFWNDAGMIEAVEDFFREIRGTGNSRERYVSLNFSGQGQKIPYRVQFISLLDDDGIFEGTQVMIQDMSEWSHDETEGRTHAVLESMPFACILWDEDLNAIACNMKTVELYECRSKNDFLDNFFDLSPPYQPDGTESLTAAKNRLRASLKYGRSIFEWEHRTKNGKPLPVEVHLLRTEWDSRSRIIAYIYDMRDLKAKESLLQEANERATLIMNATPVACSLWDERGNLLDCNREALHLYDFTEKPDDFGRTSFLKLVPIRQPSGQRSLDLLQEVFQDVLKNGYTRFYWKCHARTGDLIPLETTLVRIPWKNEYRILAYSTNISKLLRLEDKAEARMRRLLNEMPLACTLRDENNKIIDCNLAAMRMFGVLKKSEFMDNFDSFLPELQPDGSPSQERVQQLILFTLEKGYYRGEWMYRRSNGQHLPVDLTFVRIDFRHGACIAAYARDLRESKAIEQKINATNERVRTMLDALPIACVFLDEDGNAIDCNATALALYGVQSKEQFIERFSDFFPKYQPGGKESLSEKLRVIQYAFKNGSTQFDWLHLTASGEELPVSIILVHVRWNDQNCIAAYVTDMRETKRNEEKRLEADRQRRELAIETLKANAASEAKTKFLATMSHEIRTPMHAIIGMSDLIRTDNLDAKQLSNISDIKKMSKALLEIINDILDFSKIEAGKMELSPIHFNLRDMCDNLCSMCRVMAATKDLKFKYSFAEDVQQVVYGDEIRIRQVVLNLLNNAIKYTKEGHVQFAMDVAEDGDSRFTLFTVKDTGIGIKKENFSKLYDTFAQFDRETNRGTAGTGLGLTITKNLVTMMGGKIEVESEYGKGTVFRVLLPLREGDPDQVKRSFERNMAIAKRDVKILVVDDNNLNLTVALGYLAKRNIIADHASSGEQALQLLQKNRYDLVFMDHMMPEMDGLETTRLIRSLPDGRCAEIPIVALSANAVTGAKELFLNAGMNDALAKPIDSKALSEVLLKWLPEKMATVDVSTDWSENEPEDSALLSELSCVKDLDVQKGIARVGGEKNVYLNLLRQAYSELGPYRDEIRKFCAEENWVQYSIRVHTLKTVFATIGNDRLSKLASELEAASKREDAGECVRETAAFCDAITVFCDALLRTKLICEEKVEKTSMDAAMITQRLEQLKEACLDGRSDVAENVASELAKAGFNKHVEDTLREIYLLVKSYDYEKTVTLAGTLSEYLSAGVSRLRTLQNAYR